MSDPSQKLPIQEKVPVKNTIHRLSDLLISFLVLSLLCYRFSSLAARSYGVWLLASLCESCFAFVWLLSVNAKWNPVIYKTHPERLSKRFDDLPAVDMFITTADPVLEPPIVTVNTMLSMLAVEYPAHRLACYVSDDGGSPVTYYALLQASGFAKLWVPFCKKYNVRVRAPFAYFSKELLEPNTKPGFMTDWKNMKIEYEELIRKIEGAAKGYVPYHMDDELAEFTNTEKGNHPSIIKVILENKKGDDLPHLIYVAREKRPKHPHHFKAGAMNVLTRVSGVMTNAPFMLNVDCDMFVNNPEVILHGMCLLLGFSKEQMSGFVQAPQRFYDALKDDPFGNQLVVLQQILGFGIGGIQGPFYGGTGCFHRRKIIYGTSPEEEKIRDELSYEELRRIYGSSKELIVSAENITSRSTPGSPGLSSDISGRTSEAVQVAACTYENNTEWGREIGWIYGSMTEDILTGLRIHAKGWRSVYLDPVPPGFLGSAPMGGPASLTQYKRWATGLLEVLFTRNSPILATLTKKLYFRQCMAYVLINIWGLRPIPEMCYALLPAYCILTNTSFWPKASSPEFLLPVTLFTTFKIYTLGEYLHCGLSVRAWWNNQRMQRISSLTAFLFGFLSVLLKFLGISETVFEVTRKDQSGSGDDGAADPGRFTFDSSPFFVSGTALVLVHIAALGVGTTKAVVATGERIWGLGELVCSAMVLLYFWPFVRGLFGKGSFGIPWDVIWKALLLGFMFLLFCGLGVHG